jgi:hypothetical protein
MSLSQQAGSREKRPYVEDFLYLAPSQANFQVSTPRYPGRNRYGEETSSHHRSMREIESRTKKLKKKKATEKEAEEIREAAERLEASNAAKLRPAGKHGQEIAEPISEEEEVLLMANCLSQFQKPVKPPPSPPDLLDYLQRMKNARKSRLQGRDIGEDGSTEDTHVEEADKDIVNGIQAFSRALELLD